MMSRSRFLLLAGLTLTPLACGGGDKAGRAPGSGAASGAGAGAGRAGSSGSQGSAGRGGSGVVSAGTAGSDAGGEGGVPSGTGGSVTGGKGGAGARGGAGGGGATGGTGGGGGSVADGGEVGDGGEAGDTGPAGTGGGAGTGGSAGAAGSGGGAGASGTGGTSGDGGAGSSGAGSSGAGASGTAGASAAGGAGAGGTAGASGAGAAGTGGGPPAWCNNGIERTVSGTVDGTSLTQIVSGGGSFSRSTPPFWDARGRLGTDGYLHLWGPETYFGANDPASGKGLVVMPSAGPLPKTFYCASTVDIARVDTFRSAVDIDGLSELGQCPSQPGSDQLTGCFGTATGGTLGCAPEETRIIGSLGGVDLDESFLNDTHSSLNTGTSNGVRFLVFGQSGLIVFRGNTTITGFLKMPENSPTPGAIYCIGSATLLIDGSDYEFTLSSLGLVGTCPGTGVSGSLTGCL